MNGNSPSLSPDPKAILADIARELRADPDRWMQGAPARDKDGGRVISTDPKAVCWCLVGHVHKRIGIPNPGSPNIAQIFDLRRQIADLIGCYKLTQWNDEPGRTVEQVIEACERGAA